MKLIVGLGNPGRSYADTRHNVGWWVVDHLADAWRVDGWRKDHDALVANGTLDGTRLRLLKPQTYMNLSGGALRPYLRREGFRAASDLLIIVDEVALPVGRFRLRGQGSAGGHNGLKSIEGAVGGREYARLRVGVGPPPERRREGDLADYVLDRMGKSERATVMALLPELVETVETWVREGVGKAMSLHNRRPEAREPED
jgi:PTH1 family peptidyl-tRNA hydrolase